jgi:hypothetical protein
MHKIKVYQAVILIAAVSVPFREARSAEILPLDLPTQVAGIETVCTGESLDVRRDARWNDYALKIEFAGPGGQYVGGEEVSVGQTGKTLLNVECPGPWLLLQLPPGRYDVSAKLGGQTAQSAAFVSKKGQGRIILRFLGEVLASLDSAKGH